MQNGIPNSPWPSMRANQRNTGHRSPFDHPRQTEPRLKPRIHSTGTSIVATPVLGGNDIVYLGALDGQFYALDAATGSIRWRFPSDGRDPVDGAGFIGADGTVYFSSINAQVYAVTSEGKLRWQLDNGTPERRKRYSPSPIYWFEGNVVAGPTGLLYAGSDDFHLYALDPGTGDVRWAFPTGFFIWSAPAFGANGALYFGSFDMRLYALDGATGRLRWSVNTGNLVVACPAVGPEGQIYAGGFDGICWALVDHGRRGKFRWRFPTDGPIYASPTLSPRGDVVYIGSMDGFLYALNTADGSRLWRTFLGGPIVGSAALGPDPEAAADPQKYLVIVGTRSGRLYALEPTGRRRWVLEWEAFRASGADARLAGFTSSIGVGEQGLATGTSDGEIVYLPFTFYQQPDTPGLSVRPPDEHAAQLAAGPRFYEVAGNGRMATQPLAGADDSSVPPPTTSATEVISLRALYLTADEESSFAPLDPASLRVEVTPPIAVDIALSADGSLLSLVPRPTLQQVRDQAGQLRRLTVTARTTRPDVRGRSDLQTVFQARLRPSENSVNLENLAGALWTIKQMAIHSPAIVNAFDEFGIASIDIHLGIVSADARQGTLVAWGTEAVTEGVPTTRRLLYAFRGWHVGGELLLQASNCYFEITSAALPLDELRFSGVSRPSLPPANAASSEGPGLPQENMSLYASYKPRSGSSMFWQLLQGLAMFLPPWNPRYWWHWLRIASRTFSLVLRLLRGQLHPPWALLDRSEGAFRGVGAFRVFPDDSSPPPVVFEQLDTSQWQRGVLRAWFQSPGGALGREVVLGILLVNKDTNEPVELDYTSNTRQFQESQGKVGVELRAAAVGGKPLRAYVMAGTRVAGKPVDLAGS
jgi:outer membrane protein assembly factor BamB